MSKNKAHVMTSAKAAAQAGRHKAKTTGATEYTDTGTRTGTNTGTGQSIFREAGKRAAEAMLAADVTGTGTGAAKEAFRAEQASARSPKTARTPLRMTDTGTGGARKQEGGFTRQRPNLDLSPPLSKYTTDYTPMSAASDVSRWKGTGRPDSDAYGQAYAAATQTDAQLRHKQRQYNMNYGWNDDPRGIFAQLEIDDLKKQRKAAIQTMTEHAEDINSAVDVTIDGDVTPYESMLRLWENQRAAIADSDDPDLDALYNLDRAIARWKPAIEEAKTSDSGAADQTPGNAEDHNWFENYVVTTANMHNRPFVEVPPEEAWDGLKQMALGNYSDKSNMVGTMGQLLLSETPLDFVGDVRDTAYDLTHLDSIPWYQLPLDAIGLLPVAEIVNDIGKSAFHMADVADAIGDTAKHADEFADAAKAVTRTADAAEDIADTAKAGAKAVDAAEDFIDAGGDIAKHGDDVLDTADNVLYNAAKRVGDIDLKPPELMDELASSGVKYTADDVVMVTKQTDGRLVWLETGSEQNGLTHIIKKHGAHFADRGFSEDEIPDFLKFLLESPPASSGHGSKGYYAIYLYEDKFYRVAYGDNGYIKTFHPYSR